MKYSKNTYNQPEAAVNERKRIIAVDDSIENLTTIKNTLKDIYEIYPCLSAAKLFDILKHVKPDLILLDVEMPEMDGYEAAKEMQKNVKYKQIPFMFLTSRDDINSEIEGLSLGAIDYIHKPFVAPLLLQRIKTHLTLADCQKIEIISVATVTAMNHIREGFVLVDIENKYLTSNPVMAKILPGIAKLKKGDSIFMVKDWPEELNIIEHGSIEFSITNEGTRYFRTGISPVFIGNKTFVARIFLFTDITENVNYMTELEKAAYIDTLTGLYNLKHFIELAEIDIKRAERLNHSIYTAMLDIDFFQDIIDTYGHTAGDMALKAVADNIKQTLRSYDLVGRYSNEVFAVMFAVENAAEVYKIAERVRKNIEHIIVNYEGEEIDVTCSIGIAKVLENDTLKTAMQKADEALTSLKELEGNQVKVYDASLCKT